MMEWMNLSKAEFVGACVILFIAIWIVLSIAYGIWYYTKKIFKWCFRKK